MKRIRLTVIIMKRVLAIPFLFLASVLPLAAAENPGKCPACSFTAVQQPYDAVRLALTADRLPGAKKEAAKLRAAAEAEAAWAKSATGRGPELGKPWTNVATAAAKIHRRQGARSLSVTRDWAASRRDRGTAGASMKKCEGTVTALAWMKPEPVL